MFIRELPFCDGACVGGCIPGWQGEKCQEACDDFTYGDNCSSKCGACRGLTSCDKETGLCAEGCEPEFVGQLCLGKLITSKHCYSKQALNEFKFHT